MYNYCRRCGYSPHTPGLGVVRDPRARWWQFWRTVPCPDCGGTGMARPKGPPPAPPPPPPPKKYP